MKNVFTVLKNAEGVLQAQGLTEARVDAEVLLSAALGVKRGQLALMRDKEILQEQEKVFEGFIERRVNREPVAYILGSCEFMGLEFFVDENVLVPRQETELLVEEVIKTFVGEKQQQLNHPHPPIPPQGGGDIMVLDLCTGSGIISVCLAKIGGVENITAVDISHKALGVARRNAEAHGVSNISFVEGNMFDVFQNQKFDIIVSNPPYVSRDEYKKHAHELIFEPQVALIAGDYGLFFYKQIAANAHKHLRKGGFVLLELNANVADKIKTVFVENKFVDVEIIEDYAHLPRILKGKYNG